jgi:PAS domain S-box-containing protein
MDVRLKARAYDHLLQQLNAGFAILGRDLKYISINEILADFNGKKVEEHVGRHVSEVLPSLYPRIGPMLESVLCTGESLVNFTITDHQSATEEAQDWVGSYIALKNEDGETDGILVLAVNETKAQRREREQQRDLIRMRQVLNHIFAFAGVLDLDGTLLDANNPPLRQAGMTLEDVQYKLFWECSWWSHDLAVAARIKQSVLDACAGTTSRFDITAFMGDRVIDLDFMITPMYNNGRLQYLIPSAIEITARKEAELHLQMSEGRFKQVFDCAADGLIAFDNQGLIKLVNSRAQQMFQYEFTDLIGMPIEVLLPQSTRAHHQRDDYLKYPQSREVTTRQELSAQRKDGSLFPVEMGLTYLQNDPLVCVLATVTDVSTSKEIQQNLHKSLEEKSALLAERTTLLNEVHHRVKNNLQIISSLLHLQARAASPQLHTALNESQMRVRAMALTHQMLYENKSFSGVTLAHYLKQLAQLIISSLFTTSQIHLIYNELDQTIFADIDQTMSCGLLVNEIITNSVKHAFGDNHEACISLDLKRCDEGFFKLVIADNGCGMPAQTQFGNQKTMGMQLIPAFIAQLQAEFIIDVTQGTRYEIKIPVQQGD